MPNFSLENNVECISSQLCEVLDNQREIISILKAIARNTGWETVGQDKLLDVLNQISDKLLVD